MATQRLLKPAAPPPVLLDPRALEHFKTSPETTSYVRDSSGRVRELVRAPNPLEKQNAQKLLAMSVKERYQALLKGLKTGTDPALNHVVRHMPRELAVHGADIRSKAIRNALDEAAAFSQGSAPINPDEVEAIFWLIKAFKQEKKSYGLVKKKDVDLARRAGTNFS